MELDGPVDGSLAILGRLARRPAFVVGVLASIFALVVLPAQYSPVLFRHDAEFVLEAVMLLAVGCVVSGVGVARSSRGRAVLPVAGGSAAACLFIWIGTTIGYRIAAGIGLPRPLVVLVGLAEAAFAGALGAAAGTLLRSRPRWLAALACVGLIAVIGAVGIGAWLGLRASPDERTCVTRAGVSYCHFAGYEPFVARWAAVVNPVLAAAPRVPGDVPRRVVQVTGDEPASGALASPGLDWGRGSAQRIAKAGLAIGTANTLVGPRGSGDPASAEKCQPLPLRGRQVVALWLAGHAGRDVVAYLASGDVYADAVTGSTYAATPDAGALEERHAAAALHRRDSSRVRSYVAEHWDELTAVDAPAKPMLDALGVQAPETSNPCP